MIARICQGRVNKTKAKRYIKFLNAKAIPECISVPGNLGIYILRKEGENDVEIITITFWVNYKVLRNFTGENIEEPKFYKKEKKYLIDNEKDVKHFEIVGIGNYKLFEGIKE